MFCKGFCRAAADQPNAKPQQNAIQSLLLGGLDGRNQVLRRFFRKALQRDQVVHAKAVQIRAVRNQIVIQQLLNDGGTETVNVHGRPGGKVNDTAQLLRRAVGA